MFVANTTILGLRIFSWRYYFRLWVFASTDENFYCWHWIALPKLLQGKWCQDLQKPCSIILHFVLTNHMYVYCRLGHCCILSDMIRRIWSYICYILFICNGSTSFQNYSSQYTVKITGDVNKKIICSYGTQHLP